MAAEASRTPLSVCDRQVVACEPNAFRKAIDDETAFALRIFDHIPEGYGVVEVDKTGGGMLRPGEVAVYEREPFGHVPLGTLVDGAIYVQEHQREVAPQSDSRRIITRKIVRIYRATGALAKGITSPDTAWYARSLNAPFRPGEGPYYDFALAGSLIGRVVGIYAPGAIGGAS